MTTTSRYLLILLLLSAYVGFGQYTETINSNRPGQSQGAFSVGVGVVQLESGVFYSKEKHNLLATETTGWGTDFALRFGVLFPQLEINFSGSYLNENVSRLLGRAPDFTQSGFPLVTLGIKYLVYDPHKDYEPGVNLYSYHANNRFDWHALIPAVSLYTGTNYVYQDNPFHATPGVPTGSQEGFSPKGALILQHNYGRWVWVNNIISDFFTTDYPTYTWISTITHSFDQKFAGFLEYQLISSDIYADNLVRLGGAYLVGNNLQFDLSALTNFKDTPSRLQLAVGLSYRLDFHKDKENLQIKD